MAARQPQPGRAKDRMQAPRSRPFLLIGLAWLAIALALGASGRLLLLRPPAPQLVLLGLTAAVILAGFSVPAFRAWLFSIRYRQLLAFHLTRFIGVYFLVLYGRGELPWAFAVPGGWGDIIVAAAATVLVFFVPHLEAWPGWLATWNLVGLADILFVVVTASRLMLADPQSMSALTRLPLSLLPTFLVPLIISSHVFIFWRLWAERT
jgi:hypothetical protein